MDRDTSASVLIVNWNRLNYVRATLEDLRRHDYPGLEIVVVDNGSTDGAPEMIAAEFPEVQLIRLADNLGHSAAFNLGMRSAHGAIVVSLDNDATLRVGDIPRIVAKFQERPKLAILNGRVFDYDTGESVWWWEWYGLDQETYGLREFPTPWKFAEGLSAMRREAIVAAGGLAEEYFIMEAGKDLLINLIDAGWEIWYTPEVAFYHKSSAERVRTDQYRLHSERRMYYKLRNELWSLWKFYPLHQVVLRTSMKMVLWGAIMARQGSFGTYLEAMKDAFTGLPMIIRKRKRVRPETLRAVEYSRLRALPRFREAIAWYFATDRRPGDPAPITSLERKS